MELNDELLCAYLDGELDAGQREQAELALARDPGARLRLERLRQSDAALREALPLHAGNGLRAEIQRQLQGAAPASQPRRAALPWALAASLAGVMLGYLLPRAATGPQDTAAVALDARWQQPLDTLVSGSTGPQSLQVILSFQAEDGRYCRVFRAGEGEGLACREAAGWRLAAWDATGNQATAGFRAAGASALIDAAMSTLGGTPAFDVEQETGAISRGWQQP